jgi:hypothetical protein
LSLSLSSSLSLSLSSMSFSKSFIVKCLLIQAHPDDVKVVITDESVEDFLVRCPASWKALYDLEDFQKKISTLR